MTEPECNTIAAEWELFSATVVPVGSREYEVTRMHISFYAGAFALLRCIHRILEDIRENGPADAGVDFDRMIDLASEVEEFWDNAASSIQH